MIRPALAALALACAAPRSAPEPRAAPTEVGPPPDEAPLPFDPGVTRRELPNGLVTFAERAERPEGRAELRLVVLAGSVQEDDDQRGVAHLVEHMAFNGTEHFPAGTMVGALESLGMSVGADVNASTTATHTTYRLTVPTDDPHAWDTALTVLRDQAGPLRFDPAVFERERTVVIEEWRRSRGVGQRWRDAWFDTLLAGTRYAERPPIGTEASLRALTREAAVRFHHDWYRPDLMRVLVVGDIDPGAVTEELADRFGDLVGPEDPRPRVLPELPAHAGAGSVRVLADPSATRTGFALARVRPHREGRTWGAYRRLILDTLVTLVLDERLDRAARRPASPLLAASFDARRILPGVRLEELDGVAQDTDLAGAIRVAAEEVERAHRFGVTPGELDRARRALARSYEDYLARSGEETAAEAVAELERHVTLGEPVPGAAAETAWVRAALPAIGPEEVNRVLADTLAGEPTVGVSLPDRAPPVDEASLLAVLDAARTAELAPPEEGPTGAALVDEAPRPGRIARRRRVRDPELLVWELDNGMTVILRPEGAATEPVVFRWWSPGGTSVEDLADLVPARAATTIATASGLGRLDADALAAALAGVDAGIQPVLGHWDEEMRGAAAPADLPVLFRLAWLTSQRPRFDADAFTRTRERLAAWLADRDAHPHARFDAAWNRMLWQHHPRMARWRPADLDRLDLDRSRAAYRRHFGDAGDAIVVIAGAFDPDAIRPLVETWLGGIPAATTPQRWVDRGVRPVRGVHEVAVRAGHDPKALVQVRYAARSFESTPRNRYLVGTLGVVLQDALAGRLREQLGGTYAVSVQPEVAEVPVPGAALTVAFQCDPSRVDELRAALDGVVRHLREEPLPPAVVRAVAEQQRRRWEVMRQRNDWWAAAILANRQRGEPFPAIAEEAEGWRDLDAEALQSVARLVLDPTNRLAGVLLPDAPVAGPGEPPATAPGSAP